MKHAIAALVSVAMVACSDFEPQVGPLESTAIDAGVVDCGVASDVSSKVKASPLPCVTSAEVQGDEGGAYK